MAKAKGRKSSKTAAKAAARRTTAKRARAKAPAAKGLSLGPSAVSLTVDDITASMTWYCDVLGFAVKERWDEGGFVGAALQCGDAAVYLGQDDWKKGRDRAKGEGLRLHLYVKTAKDVDRFAEQIRHRGGSLASEPQDAWGSRTFNMVDPTGYKITIASVR